MKSLQKYQGYAIGFVPLRICSKRRDPETQKPRYWYLTTEKARALGSIVCRQDQETVLSSTLQLKSSSRVTGTPCSLCLFSLTHSLPTWKSVSLFSQTTPCPIDIEFTFVLLNVLQKSLIPGARGFGDQMVADFVARRLGLRSPPRKRQIFCGTDQH